MTIPLSLSCDGRPVVVVGGGRVAAAKAAALATGGARLTVVAPVIGGDLRAAASTLLERPYAGPDDLAGAWLVVAATGVAEVDDAVVADAEALRIWCVRSGGEGEAGRAGTASFMATLRRGPLVVAVASGAPAVSRYVRQQVEETIGPEHGELAALLAAVRRDPLVRAHLASLDDSQRKTVWRSLPIVHILGLIREGAFDSATELAAACLSSSSD